MVNQIEHPGNSGDLPDIARQAIAAGLDPVRWDQEGDLRGHAEDQDAEPDENDAQYQQSHTQFE